MSKLGLHIHAWNDPIFRYCKTVGGAVHIILDHNEIMVNAVKKAQPKSLLVARLWVPEQKLDDPIGRADEFVDLLMLHIDGCHYDAATGYNEWDGDLQYHRGGPEGLEIWKRYADFEARRSQLLHAYGLKSVVGGCSVGTPPEHWFSHFLPALEEGDFLHLHEYSAPHMWDHTPWHLLKYRHVYKYLEENGLPMLPLIISECGVDGGVAGRPREGWRKFGPQGMRAKSRGYMGQWDWYDGKLMEDEYVVGSCAFDCGPQPGMGWQSFKMDPEMLPLYAKRIKALGVSYWEPKEEEVKEPIRVKIHDDVRDPHSPVLGVETMEMEEYLRGVVPQEMPPGWPPEALKAQAVAARCYAKNACEHPRHGEDADVCNTIHCQAWLPLHFATTDGAVGETEGVVARYEGKIINAFYSGHCGGQTVGNEEVWGGVPLPYARPVDCIAKGKRWGREQYGHRVGLCQWGAHDWAIAGANYVEILCHYYTGIEVGGQEVDYKKKYETLEAASIAAINTLQAGLKEVK